ncbi:MAG TPA: nuclear transport factor 2 family protein [Steroidobacteraceae bacterium]|nr:nuclear transport factor 2 family protein [Steroidobacteraceae bacterium]
MYEKLRVFALVGLISLVALGRGCAVPAAGASASAADAELLREVRDRAEIDALMWRYVRALDSLDENAYADLYTADGSFGSGARAAKGHEALKKVITDVQHARAEREAKSGAKSPKMYHVITNPYLEFTDRDHARLQSYWMTVFAAADSNSQPRVAAVGRSVDELVRVDGQWRIHTRDVAPRD